MNRVMEEILRECDYRGYSVIMYVKFPHSFPKSQKAGKRQNLKQ